MARILYEQIYDYLLEKIRNGEYQSGERLPSEKELIQQFNVSRITTKKAMEKLALQGLIQRSRGRGSFVMQTSIDGLEIFRPGGAQAYQVPNQQIPKHPKTGLIGVLIPDFDDSFGTRFLKAAQAQLKQHSLMMLLFRTGDDESIESDAIDRLLAQGVDGILVIPSHGEYYNERLLRLVVDRFPLVVIDRYMRGVPACSVYTDNYQAAKDLAAYLLETGHTHFGVLSPAPQGTSSLEDRLQGLTDALKQQDLTFRPQDHILTVSTLPGSFKQETIEKDHQIIASYLRETPMPVALVACEYNLALLTLQVTRDLGLLVPEQVSIACFDSNNNPFTPIQFTHIQQDEEGFASQSVKLLIDQISNREVQPRNIIPHTLILGQTTGKI